MSDSVRIGEPVRPGAVTAPRSATGLPQRASRSRSPEPGLPQQSPATGLPQQVSCNKPLAAASCNRPPATGLLQEASHNSLLQEASRSRPPATGLLQQALVAQVRLRLRRLGLSCPLAGIRRGEGDVQGPLEGTGRRFVYKVRSCQWVREVQLIMLPIELQHNTKQSCKTVCALRLETEHLMETEADAPRPQCRSRCIAK